MIRPFLSNHVLANLAFGLVLVVGFLCYGLLPRQQDPEMNFNWINIITFFPGASAEDVEQLVTDRLEEALEKTPDIRFVSSTSTEGYSSILVRFQELDERTFDKRVTDLRREIQNKEEELPAEVDEPRIWEITSANGFPTVMAVVRGQAEDENLRRRARAIQKDLERLKGVDKADPIGLSDPEIQVRFDPVRLAQFGLTPLSLADALAGRFRDESGGAVAVGEKRWLLRFEGASPDPDEIARWPVSTSGEEVTLGQVAQVARAREKPRHKVRLEGQPGVVFAITKQPMAHALELTARIRDYADKINATSTATGVELILVDDQTHRVSQAIAVMEGNALLGLFLVMATVWVFLGSRIALLVGLGIPFSLAGTFAVIYALGGTLNVMALLGVVIALGMLVDDAVVIVESIYDRLARGEEVMEATVSALREVFAPVLSSVLTTMAAFLPLMLLPGILGKFMRVIPAVVSLSLAISLVEAFWMLPAHVIALKPDFVSRPSALHVWRTRFLRRLRHAYAKLLLRFLRRPRLSLALFLLPVPVAVAIVAAGLVRVDFFAMDLMPLFYVNVKMPAGSELARTMAATVAVEARVKSRLAPGEAHAVVSYAGQMMTETEPYFGDRWGQVMVSLVPDAAARRTVKEIMDDVRAAVVGAVPGPEQIAFLTISGGPPQTKPINIKVRGEVYEEILPAVEEVKRILAGIPEVSEIVDDFSRGQDEVVFRVDDEAARRAGLPPALAPRLVRLLGEGEVAAEFQDRGEKVKLRVLADPAPLSGLHELLQAPVPLPGGGDIPLSRLTRAETRQGIETIRHYDFRRAITVQAELDQEKMDILTANNRVRAAWAGIAGRFPGVDLDFSGILDDIEESLDGIVVLFLFGVGLMYLILGTQFRAYFQPLIILATVPVAFSGVCFGLLFSGHPLSLYTLYGVVALSGIAVNATIVLFAAANDRVAAGLSVPTAILLASRRRVVPILITSLTTIAGLLSLATGLGGRSLMWGPVATSIVWGLSFSTALTLFLMPLLYLTFMRRAADSHPKS